MKYIHTLLIIVFLASANPVFAVIGSERSAGEPADYDAPSIPTNITLNHQGDKVVITWTDPTENDFYLIKILRNDGTGTQVTGVVRYQVGKGIERFEDTDVQAGQNYIYRFRTMDRYYNERLSDEYSTVAIVAEAVAVVTDTTAVAVVEDVGAVAKDATVAIVALIEDPSNIDILINNFSLTRNEQSEAEYKSLILADSAEFGISMTVTDESAITNYTTYGISQETINLGAGERRAVIRDYFATVGRGNIDWNDIQRMTKGEKPVSRNLPKEVAQLPVVLAMWNKMVGHNPNFQDSAEDLAWNTMMYRVRFTRNLAKEGVGISKFKDIFNRLPASPLDWAGVRALGYVL